MRLFENQEFGSDDFPDRDSGSLFSDIEFRGCYFQGCSLSVTLKPELRSKVRRARLIDCSERGCSIYGAILEDVFVDGLKTNGHLLQVWGAAFSRVVLQGKVDRLMISSVVIPGVASPDEQREFDEANSEYYRRVDWALDISRGEFRELDIRGVPIHLIRRDPETQVVVTRQKALEGKWEELEFTETLWWTWLNHFIQTEEPGTVLVAPKRHPKFRRYLQDLRLLQDAGIAEPN